MVSGDQGSTRGSTPKGRVPGKASPPSSTASGDATTPQQRPHPRQTPLYHAHHADRYHRQELIEAYQEATGARLVVAFDVIDFDFVLNLEEHLLGQPRGGELHLLLRSPGGDGEQAIRAIRVLQSRCSKLVVIIPDMAKSAATLLALGADEIRLGPASDLGPVDPQMEIAPDRWYAAKDIIAAVRQAEAAVSLDRTLTPLWSSLLSEVTALDVQAAKAELDRTGPMIRQALGYRTNPPDADTTERLVGALLTVLQEETTTHGASLGPSELGCLKEAGVELPIIIVDPSSWEWECIWRLFALYWVQVGGPIYESDHASFRPSGPHPA